MAHRATLAGKRVIVITLGSRGDVQPFLALCESLRRAGAHPLLLTLPHYVGLCTAHSVPAESILDDGSSWPQTTDMSGGESQEEFEERLVIAPYERHLPALLERVRQTAKAHPPDVVVVGMLVWFVCWLREVIRAPLVHVYLQPPRWLSTQLARHTRSRFAQRLARVPLLDNGFASLHTAMASELQLLAYPRGLGVTHLPGMSGRITGFWRLSPHGTLPLPAELAAFLTTGTAPVCVNFGSMAVYGTPWASELLHALEAYCRAGGGRLVAIGSTVPRRLSQWPNTCVVPSAPHDAVFPKCACVVHHGGAGTTAAAIAARVPSLVVPHLTWIDQARWGRWLERARAGVCVLGPELGSEERTRDRFAAALRRVLGDSTLREGVVALASELEAESGGVDDAVRLIGEHLLVGGRVEEATAKAELQETGRLNIRAAALVDEDDEDDESCGGADDHDGADQTTARLVRLARRIAADDSMTATTPLIELSSLELLELHACMHSVLRRRPSGGDGLGGHGGSSNASGAVAILPLGELLLQPTLGMLAAALLKHQHQQSAAEAMASCASQPPLSLLSSAAEPARDDDQTLRARWFQEASERRAVVGRNRHTDAYPQATAARAFEGGGICGDDVGGKSGACCDGRPRRRQRCLFLHGLGASAELQSAWLERTGWLACLSELGVDVLLIDGSFASAPQPQLLPPHARDEYLRRPPHRGWGDCADKAALQRTIAYVQRAIRTHAPIDGICGFSQGGLVAAAVAATMAAEEKQPKPAGASAARDEGGAVDAKADSRDSFRGGGGGVEKLRWFLNMSGLPWQWLHVSTRARLPLIDLPSLHLISEADPLLDGALLRSLPARFDSPTVILHTHGHEVPRITPQMAAHLRTFLAQAAEHTRTKASAEAVLVPQLAMAEASHRDEITATAESPPGDAFLWRAMLRRQRRWYACDARGHPVVDQSRRFKPSAPNPLPALSPQDKLRQRAFLARLPFDVPQPRLLATFTRPAELLGLLDGLPSSWVLKPVGAAYSRGVFVVREGLLASGLPFSVWGAIDEMRQLQTQHEGAPVTLAPAAAATAGAAAGPEVGSEVAGAVETAAAEVDGGEFEYNCSQWLIEEYVTDACVPAAAVPTDYRFFVCGDTIAFVEITAHDPTRLHALPLQAAVDEGFELYPPAYDADEYAGPLCTRPELLPPRPHCWPALLAAARRLGGALGVFCRLDWYADSHRGPLLGEVTLLPNMGDRPSARAAWVDRLVRRLWRSADGPPPLLSVNACPGSSSAGLAATPDAATSSSSSSSSSSIASANAVAAAATVAAVPPAEVRSLCDALARCTHGVIVPWSADEISTAVSGFDLGRWGVAPGARVALLLPSGGAAALLLLATMSRYVAMPLDPHAPSAATAAQLRQLRASCLIAPAGRAPIAQRAAAAALASGVGLIGVDVTLAPRKMLSAVLVASVSTSLSALSSSTTTARAPATAPLLTLGDVVLVLSTSGTTGAQKSVPFRLSRLLASGEALATSMSLGTADVGLNMGLPLHHVGGIACNLIAPLLSRGRMVFEGAFSAEAWLQRVAARSPADVDAPSVTWCYLAAPMWRQIASLVGRCNPTVATASVCSDDPFSGPIVPGRAASNTPRHHLRLLRSGAARLPHADAVTLAHAFGCCVLPTYSMTECMPITSPALGYALDIPESVGVAIGGVQLRIVHPLPDEAMGGGGASGDAGAPGSEANSIGGMDDPLPTGEIGEVAIGAEVRGGSGGELLFDGYEEEPVLSDRRCSANTKRWFRTGDLGRLDTDGCLRLTGRLREMVHRGGEILSPAAIEDILAKHPAFSVPVAASSVRATTTTTVALGPRLMVFAAPHEELDEVVGVAITASLGALVTLRDIRSWARQHLPSRALPAVLVLVPDPLPTTATGKLRRARFAERLRLPPLRGAATRTFAVARSLDSADGAKGEAVEAEGQTHAVFLRELNGAPNDPLQDGMVDMRVETTPLDCSDSTTSVHAFIGAATDASLAAASADTAETAAAAVTAATLSDLQDTSRSSSPSPVTRAAVTAFIASSATSGASQTNLSTVGHLSSLIDHPVNLEIGSTTEDGVEIGLDEPLLDSGWFDSLSAVDLALRLRELTRQPLLPLTLLWEYPTIRSILDLVVHDDSAGEERGANGGVAGNPGGSGERSNKSASSECSSSGAGGEGEGGRCSPLVLGPTAQAQVRNNLQPYCAAGLLGRLRDRLPRIRSSRYAALPSEPPLASPTAMAASAHGPDMRGCCSSRDGGRLTCLFLHGKAASGSLMQELLRGAGWIDELGSEVTFVCADAPHRAQPQPELYSRLVAAGLYSEDLACYDYGIDTDADATDLDGTATEAAAERVRESVAYVERLMRAHRPVQILGGICDGGLLATLVAARSAADLQADLRLLLNVCGSPWERLPAAVQEAARGASALVEVPSIHLIGQRDELLSQEELLSLTHLCADVRVLRHPQGHALPALSARITPQLWMAIHGARQSAEEEHAEVTAAGKADAFEVSLDVGGEDDEVCDGDDRGSGGDSGSEAAMTDLPDSMRLFARAAPPCAITGHIYFASLTFVVIGHWHELFGGGRDSCAADSTSSIHCTEGFHALITAGGFVPLQAFLILAGGIDAKLPPPLLRTVARKTLIGIGCYLWLLFYSDVPEVLSDLVHRRSMQPIGRGVLASFHRELAWCASPFS